MNCRLLTVGILDVIEVQCGYVPENCTYHMHHSRDVFNPIADITMS